MAIRINLPDKQVALVDEEDAKLLEGHSWFLLKRPGDKNIYARAKIKGKPVLMHRLILEAPKGSIIDHINGNGLDNRKSNLRFCSMRDNSRNRKIHIGNKSGFKGVLWKVRNKKWQARICVNYKDISLGLFLDKEDAARAYNAAARKYFGEFAYLNKI